MTHRVVGTAVRLGAVTLALTAGVTLQSRAQGQIAIGQVVQNQLTAASPVNAQGRRYAMWTFMGNAGQAVQIDMQSTGIDSYLILQDQNGQQLSFNDDGGGGLNSRISYTLPYTGAFRLLTMSYGTSGNVFGTYTLSITSSGQMGQPMVQPLVQPMANPSGVVGSIGVGQQAQNTLTTGDARFENKPFQAYNFQCTAGLAFQLNVLSTWDNYALIFDPMGQVVGRNDDAGEGLNAQIDYTCPMNGTYRLAVSVYSASTTPGQYTMQVVGTSGPTMMMQPTVQPMGQPMDASGMIAQPGQMATIAYGQQLQGRLEPGDRQMQDSTFADVWMYQGTAGQRITIDLTSDNFDSYLQLLDGSGGRLAEDDDSGGNLNARISFSLPANAQYQIVVNNYGSSRRAGAYTLWVH